MKRKHDVCGAGDKDWRYDPPPSGPEGTRPAVEAVRGGGGGGLRNGGEST